MLEKLYELVMGEEGVIVTLRCENRFDEEKYNDIKAILCDMVEDWKSKELVPKKAMLIMVELIECLVGGSRFLSYETAITVEDASIEIKDILNKLYESL